MQSIVKLPQCFALRQVCWAESDSFQFTCWSAVITLMCHHLSVSSSSSSFWHFQQPAGQKQNMIQHVTRDLTWPHVTTLHAVCLQEHCWHLLLWTTRSSSLNVWHKAEKWPELQPLTSSHFLTHTWTFSAALLWTSWISHLLCYLCLLFSGCRFHPTLRAVVIFVLFFFLSVFGFSICELSSSPPAGY